MKLLRTLIMISLLPSSAFAHDFWLEPDDTFTPAVGDVASIRMFVGEAFKPEQELPGVADRVTRLEILGPRGPIDASLGGRRDPLPAIALSHAGTYVVAMERSPSFITLPAEQFNSYLEEEGHHAIIAARLKDGSYGRDARERYTRHIKMILTAGEPSDSWSHVFGTRLEIVPLSNPSELKSGEVLPLRVLFEGKPLPGARVGLVTRSGETISREKFVRTNDKGEAKVTLASGGDLLVRATMMRPCLKCEDSDYESFWSSMTVSIPQ